MLACSWLHGGCVLMTHPSLSLAKQVSLHPVLQLLFLCFVLEKHKTICPYRGCKITSTDSWAEAAPGVAETCAPRSTCAPSCLCSGPEILLFLCPPDCCDGCVAMVHFPLPVPCNFQDNSAEFPPVDLLQVDTLLLTMCMDSSVCWNGIPSALYFPLTLQSESIALVATRISNIPLDSRTGVGRCFYNGNYVSLKAVGSLVQLSSPYIRRKQQETIHKQMGAAIFQQNFMYRSRWLAPRP